MADGKRTCGGKDEGDACLLCGEREMFSYWCDGCKQAVAEKRCPLCGLKAWKTR